MQLIILGSSSKGNCYLLKSASEILIIEAGIKLSEVKKAVDFDMSKIVGCIVSHQHGDHAGNVYDFLSNGIHVLAISEVFGVGSNAFKSVIFPNKGYKLGSFKIYCFSVSHDVPCLGFTIEHPESGKILFLTDAMSCDYSFDNLSHVLIEANYSDHILNSNIKAGKVPQSMRPRLLSTHMEIETTKQVLRNQDLTYVKNIVLIHLSDGNSNEKQFVNEIQALTGKPTTAANKGMIINFSKELF